MRQEKESKAYKSGEFDEMFEAAEIGSLAAEDIVAYSQSKRRYDDMQLAYEYSFAKGEAEGRAEGREEGRAEGKAEIIRLLHENGMSVQQIAHIVNMSLTEIENML